MATQNLPSTPPLAFPQTQNLHPIFQEIVGRFVPIQPPIQPLQSECCYESEWGDCNQPATVHHLESERDLCARHWRKVVGRG